MATIPTDCIGLAEVARAAMDLQAAGRPAVAGRVVELEGFSTWFGDELVVADGAGTQHGWLLGALGARRIGEAARALLAAGGSDLGSVDIDVAGGDVADVGLSCGGRAELLLQPTAAIPPQLWTALAERAPVALLTCIDGPGRATASMVVAADGATSGRIAGETAAVVSAAVELLAGGHSATRRVPSEEGTVLVEAWVPASRLVVVGSGDLVDALAAQAGLLGWELEAVDDRLRSDAGDRSDAGAGPDGVGSDGVGVAGDAGASGLAEPAPAPAGGVTRSGEPAPAGSGWPALDEALAWAGASAALIVLSHDPHVDVPALGAALERGAPYIGAMGSRRTQSRRMARMSAAGWPDDQLERIHRPVGLDLGGRSAPEVAMAICAEILAVRCGREARSLRDTVGPIRDRPGPSA